MNDTTNNTPSIAEAIANGEALTQELKQSAIDAIITKQSKGMSGIFREEITGRTETGSAAVNMTADGVGTLTSEELFELAQQTAASEDGTANFEADYKNAEARAQALHEKLEAHTFDPRTGEKVYNVKGAARDAMILQAKAAFQEVELAAYTAQAVAAKRAERQSLAHARDAEDALKMAWAGTDPKRQAAIEDAILREEASEIARKVLALRKVGR